LDFPAKRARSCRLTAKARIRSGAFASLEGSLRNTAAADKKVEELQEQLLQATADMADAMRQMVDGLEEAINAAAEERPFDPQVEEAKEFLEELRKEYPKLD
jgi:ABC-type transporter Mla subunit MlaD